MKLYKVTIKGMIISEYHEFYVCAPDATEAYCKVKEYLDGNNLGSERDRELHTIEFIAEDAEYPKCGTRLFQ